MDDDRDRVAGLRREALVEQVDGGLRVGSGGHEVLLVLTAERHRREIDSDEHDDPGDTTTRRCRKDQEVMRFNMSACFRGRASGAARRCDGADRDDAALTATARGVPARVSEVSALVCRLIA